ncbi:hypothetical protein AVEN_231815-1 [Araneus ventricosus]|uniref:Mutator-like transposase domain-containing protein n=1 Tax=Araneus ventricosus TaxID=182803 RepID=A0A4Y2WME3_ARAVE|nr:hypothetical protein AVEN_231815-1 [Araneus ventricosus]
MSLNGCVSVISIDTGKILDLEVMTQYCKMCEMNIKCDHECSNYKGSSGNMESVGAFRIFERSVMKRELQYTEYYGDGDSKAFLKVKDIYGEDTVTKLECIGHVQKRVGSRLRKLKKNQRTRWKRDYVTSCVMKSLPVEKYKRQALKPRRVSWNLTCGQAGELAGGL